MKHDPPSVALIDFTPFVDQVVARLQSLLLEQRDGQQPPKKAFRAGEVAALLSMSAGEIRALMASGELESIKVGRMRLVPSSAIDRFIERKWGQQSGDS